MALTLHNLAPKKGSRTKSFRVGRGAGTGRGKTAGRGTKGQRSRSGGKKKLKLKGLKQMLLGFPKMRGFRSRYGKDVVIRLEQLNRFEDGATVDLQALRKANLLIRTDKSAKVITSGAITKKLNIKGIGVSAGAKAAIEKAGGKIL